MTPRRKQRAGTAKVVKAWCVVEDGKLLPWMTRGTRYALVEACYADPPKYRIARVEIRELPRGRARKR